MAVIVNNLGGTSNLELSLMAGEVVKYLGKGVFNFRRHFENIYDWLLERIQLPHEAV